MKEWAVEVAIPWLWRRAGEHDICEQLLISLYWTDGPGFAISFTRDSTWKPLRAWTGLP